MKKILITGITGFAGSFLAEELATYQDVEIHGTYLTESSLQNVVSIKDKLVLKKIDLTDFKVVEEYIASVKPDEVYHLAALPSPAQSFADPGLFLQNNINAELYILEALRKHNLTSTKLLIVASAEVYGNITPDDLPIDEEVSFKPVNPYGVSKVAQDMLGYQYFVAHKIQAIRVRPFNHIGPRLSDAFALSAFSKKIVEIEKGSREPVLTVGNLDAKRDFTDVRDMMHAYVLAVAHGVPGDVYNIGSGKSVRIGDMLDQLLALSTKKDIKVEKDPVLLRPNDIPDFVCNNKKFVDLTGWKTEVPFEQSLKDTLDYWRGIV